MEAIKRAIRSALEKGDAQDRAFRERVYRQTFAAFERSIQSRGDLTAEDVRARRERVKELIIEIEGEFLPAAPAETPAAPPPPETGAELDFAPREAREDRLSATEEPRPGDLGANTRADRTYAFQGTGRRRLFSIALAAAALIAVIAVAGWFLSSGGPAGEATPDTAGQDRGEPGRDIQASGDWITVFSPNDPTTARAGGGTSAEAIEEEGEVFMRIGGGPEARVSFDIGQGILERLAGERVVFSLSARAQEGEETQISIACDFGTLGDCARRRYVVGPSRTDYLLETELPDRQPSGGGTITVVPDMEGEGRALDVFSVRVATAE